MGIPLALWAAWWVWWTWPVQIRINTYLDGKTFYVDGEQRGMTNGVFRFRPGTYAGEFVFDADGPERPRYPFTLEVAPRQPSEVFLVFDPAHVIQRLEEPPLDRPFAWLQVSTNVETPIWLRVGDHVFEDAPAICALPLEFGRYEVGVEASGHRAQEVEITVDDQELVHVPLHLAELEDPWHTVLLYGPDAWNVREGLVTFEGLRTFLEESTDRASSLIRHEKTYWGPSESFEVGTAVVRVELPFPPSAILVERNVMDLVVDGWDRIDMGPSPSKEDLIPIFSRRPERLPEELRAPGLSDTPSQESFDRLAEAMQGRTTLYIRFRVGGVPSGESVSLACALRSNGRPVLTKDGTRIWDPAVTIRVLP